MVSRRPTTWFGVTCFLVVLSKRKTAPLDLLKVSSDSFSQEKTFVHGLVDLLGVVDCFWIVFLVAAGVKGL